MSKKGIIIYISIVVVVAVMLTLCIMSSPQAFNKKFTGVQFQLGNDNLDELKAVSISFDGRYSNGPFFKHEFRGTVSISIDGERRKGESYIVLYEAKKTTGSLFLYRIEGENPDKQVQIGNISVNKEFDQLILTIPVIDKIEGNMTYSNWNSSDGLVIACNATTREEGIAIYNEFSKVIFLR